MTGTYSCGGASHRMDLFPDHLLNSFQQHFRLFPQFPLSILPTRPRLSHRLPEPLPLLNLLPSFSLPPLEFRSPSFCLRFPLFCNC